MEQEIIDQGITFRHLSKLYPNKDYLELIDSFSKLDIQETSCSLCLEPNHGVPIEPCDCIFFKIHSSCLPSQRVLCSRCQCYYGGPLHVLKDKQQTQPTITDRIGIVYNLFLRYRQLPEEEQVIRREPRHFRCLGTTQSGGRCSRSSINYCHQHRSQNGNRLCLATTGRGEQCTRQAHQDGFCRQHHRVNRCDATTRRGEPCSRKRTNHNYCNQHARIHLQD